MFLSALIRHTRAPHIGFLPIPRRYADAGITGDTDFLEMISGWKEKHPLLVAPFHVKNVKICVCVRKRPLNSKEKARQEHDALSVANPYCGVCKHTFAFPVCNSASHSPFRLSH